MAVLPRLRKLGWLALGPALFMSAGAFPAHAAGKDAATQQTVSREEQRIVKALAAKDSKSLQRSVSTLGAVIGAAMKRKQAGGEVTPCEMAAHSLGFAALSASEALAQKGDARQVLKDDATAAAGDFQTDMQACDKNNSRKTGNHAGVVKALRAL
ncbi:hypothetical protein [Rhizobium halophytocola]|uniref:Uncharacterized protein n=1 Tax=Rhizobium halophytocola TaxID=735519 RepID=A0ABS4E152_9HYPH|nr:hypothetical protein [Rhizobium halophytocola]MBP1851673.1 hypothetical protein [Rhizobium halophytocola]